MGVRAGAMWFLMIVKATKESEAGVMPTEQELAEMAKYNEQGAMLDGAGLDAIKKA